MRSITFVLTFLICFAVSIHTPYLKEVELLCFVLSFALGAVVISLSKHKILHFEKFTFRWLLVAFFLGLTYGIGKFITKYFLLDHAVGSSKNIDLIGFIETILFLVIMQPLLEEFLFRGIFFDDIKRFLGIRWAILLTSISFVFLHIKNFDINPVHESIFLMLPGTFIYTYLKLKTDNFLVSYTAHSTYNLTVILLLLISTQIA